ncbi:hypothetical protein H0H93_003351 [Arthromyces matolae]|nr:hypothetical protein H0H93_003351 [Arthromyces matolae]
MAHTFSALRPAANREGSRRERRPTEKVQQQVDERAQAESLRKEKEVQKTAKLRRQQVLDSEDEGHESDEETNRPQTTFSTHTVASKPSQAREKALKERSSHVPFDNINNTMTDRGRSIDRQNVSRNRSSSAASSNRDSTPSLSSRKRHASSSPIRSAKEPKSASNQPRAADYDELTQEYIYRAILLYRVLLSGDLAFPTHAQETQAAIDVWAQVCSEFSLKFPLTPRIAKLITNRGSQLRGELKTKAASLVEVFYDFETGHNRKILKKNRDKAEYLKEDNRYIYKVHDEDITKCQGLYQSKLIQKIVNAMWFKDKEDEGVIFFEDFSPFPIPALALVLTVIDCCLDEWITGVKTQINFSSKLYRDTYNAHLKDIEQFEKYTKDHSSQVLESICTKLHNRGRFNAGARPASELDNRTVHPAAFAAAIQEYDDDPNTDTDGEGGPSDEE